MTSRRPASAPTIVSSISRRPRRDSRDRRSASAASRNAASSCSRRSFSRAAENGSSSVATMSRCSSRNVRCRSAATTNDARSVAPAREGHRPGPRPSNSAGTSGASLAAAAAGSPVMQDMPRPAHCTSRRSSASLHGVRGDDVPRAVPRSGQRRPCPGRVLNIKPPDQQRLQRQMLGQHRRDGGRRFADLDVTAGLPPHVQQAHLENVPYDPTRQMSRKTIKYHGCCPAYITASTCVEGIAGETNVPRSHREFPQTSPSGESGLVGPGRS